MQVRWMVCCCSFGEEVAGDDVVDVSGWLVAVGPFAVGVCCEVGGSGLAPVVVVAALVAGGSAVWCSSWCWAVLGAAAAGGDAWASRNWADGHGSDAQPPCARAGGLGCTAGEVSRTVHRCIVVVKYPLVGGVQWVQIGHRRFFFRFLWGVSRSALAWSMRVVGMRVQPRRSPWSMMARVGSMPVMRVKS